MGLPIYECSNCYNEYSDQLYPVNIEFVKWLDFTSRRCPDGLIQIGCYDAQWNEFYVTTPLKCYVSKKGRYAIWGKHRFYEGYSGPIFLRGVPYSAIKGIKNTAEPYGTIVE